MTERVSSKDFAQFRATPVSQVKSPRPELDILSIKKSINEVIDTKLDQLSYDLHKTIKSQNRIPSNLLETLVESIQTSL
jgi:predicted nucleotidyltransferase